MVKNLMAHIDQAEQILNEREAANPGNGIIRQSSSITFKKDPQEEHERSTNKSKGHSFAKMRGKTFSVVENEFKQFDYDFSLNFIQQTLSKKNISKWKEGVKNADSTPLMKSRVDEQNDPEVKATQLSCKLFCMFHQIVLVLSDLHAGCLKLTRTVSESRPTNFAYFMSFLQVLETYGTGYSDDIDSKNYKLRDSESHKISTIKFMQKI